MTDPLRDAAETMRIVRDRCVWTQQMTHRELVPYLVEESAELIDAVEEGSRAELREELGDLLWQVLFHAEIASRAADDAFDIDDVARALTEKMVRRHPHVFGDAVASTPDEVLVLWNAAKDAEKRERTSVLDGVSERMPSLALAQKLLGRAARLSAPPALPAPPALDLSHPAPDTSHPAPDSSKPRIPAETQDVAHGLAENPLFRGERPATTEEDLGDALLALVALARESGWDAERALRERLRALESAIRSAESDPP